MIQPEGKGNCYFLTSKLIGLFLGQGKNKLCLCWEINFQEEIAFVEIGQKVKGIFLLQRAKIWIELIVSDSLSEIGTWD